MIAEIGSEARPNVTSAPFQAFQASPAHLRDLNNPVDPAVVLKADVPRGRR